MNSIDGPECKHGWNLFNPIVCPQCEDELKFSINIDITPSISFGNEFDWGPDIGNEILPPYVLQSKHLEDRDFTINPYSKDEQRVVEYFRSIAPDLGGGNDPIGFLIASHGIMRSVANGFPDNTDADFENDGDWKPHTTETNGFLYAIDEFISLCEHGAITNIDGAGYYANSTHVSNREVIPDDFYKRFTDYINPEYTHVLWVPRLA